MFVSESNIFDPGNVKIKVSSMDGNDLLLEVNPNISIDHLKIQISSHLYDPVESVKISLYHRLLHLSSGATLDGDKTLSQCGIRDNDELLLIKKRVPGPALDGGPDAKAREDSKKTPSTEDIKQATRGVGATNTDRPRPAILQPQISKEELRKILVSLIDAAQKILCLNPEAAKLFKEAEKCVTEEAPVISDLLKVDQGALQQLMTMGFSKTRSIKALHKNEMSVTESIQWLLEHDGDTDIDEPLELLKPTVSQETKCPPEKPAEGATASDEINDQALKLATMSGTDKVKKMLERFRAYRRREFKPNPKALRRLVEMGFTEADALDALCIHGNKQEEACEWLLAGGHADEPDQDFVEGLDKEGPVYKAIMANPVVQLGLSNPKSLLAFLMILENPNSTAQWLNDADTGPMLIQISCIYHAERQNDSSLSSSQSGTHH